MIMALRSRTTEELQEGFGFPGELKAAIDDEVA